MCTTTLPHHLNLATTIEIGKGLFPNEMPEEVTVFAIGTKEVTRVSEEMTEKVQKAIPETVNLILEEIGSNKE